MARRIHEIIQDIQVGHGSISDHLPSRGSSGGSGGGSEFSPLGYVMVGIAISLLLGIILMMLASGAGG